MNVPPAERCSHLLGSCEIQRLAEFVGIDPATPRYVPPEPAAIRGIVVRSSDTGGQLTLGELAGVQVRLEEAKTIGRFNGRPSVNLTVTKTREASTEVEVLEKFDEVSLIKAKLKTGRTHQVRVHLAHHGHPVAAGGPVIVLEHDAIVEPQPVVHAPAAANRVLLEHAQPRRGLAGVENLHPVRPDLLHKGARQGGDARHPLQEVERRALGREYRAGRTVQFTENRPLIDAVAVIGKLLDEATLTPADQQPLRAVLDRVRRVIPAAR